MGVRFCLWFPNSPRAYLRLLLLHCEALLLTLVEQVAADAGSQDFSDMVAAKAAQQKRKAAERKEKAKKKESFKF